ncbi:hypothetical protein FS842_007496 [Serendipita sp. 407]|nr:hypothetical protein FS842_007496 [Serendipita sp. 407]
MMKLVQLNGLTMRGHTLVWHSQLPSWVSGGSWTNATLTDVMISHITGVMNKYKGLIHTWDVVNEAIADDGTMRQSIFYTTIGETFIDIAFKTAKSIDSKAILAINDYNIEGSGSKSTTMLNLVSRVKARGAPIEQIGIQAHLIVGSLPGGIDALWANYAALGVSIAVTELDIRMPTPPTATKLAQQATDYTTMVRACLNQPKCLGVTCKSMFAVYIIPKTLSNNVAFAVWGLRYAYLVRRWYCDDALTLSLVTNTLGCQTCLVDKVLLAPSTNRCNPNRHTLPSAIFFPAKREQKKRFFHFGYFLSFCQYILSSAIPSSS